jgi:hypothetical protein
MNGIPHINKQDIVTYILIAKQRRGKHASSTIQAVYCVVRAESYKITVRRRDQVVRVQRSSWVGSEESSLGTPACRDMSLGGEELIWVESSELAAAE